MAEQLSRKETVPEERFFRAVVPVRQLKYKQLPAPCASASGRVREGHWRAYASTGKNRGERLKLEALEGI